MWKTDHCEGEEVSGINLRPSKKIRERFQSSGDVTKEDEMEVTRKEKRKRTHQNKDDQETHKKCEHKINHTS